LAKKIFKNGLLSISIAFSFLILGIKIGEVHTQKNIYDLKIIWLWLIDLGTILAGIGTVIASYVGFLALNNWKSQSKGESSLARLIKTQENVLILCCEFLPRTTSVMGKEKEELYDLVKATEDNLSILTRQIKPNDKILEIKNLLFMPRIRIRDSGVLWEDEKEKLKTLEIELRNYIENR